MSVEDSNQSQRGSFDSLQRCLRAEIRQNRANVAQSGGFDHTRLFWPTRNSTGRARDPPNGDNTHPFVIKVEEATSFGSASGPLVKTTVLEDALQVEDEPEVSHAQGTAEEQKAKPEEERKKKESAVSKPFRLFSFCRKGERKKKTKKKKKVSENVKATAPPSTPEIRRSVTHMPEAVEDSILNTNGLTLFQPVIRPDIKRNGELPSLDLLANAPTVPSIHNQDEPVQHELKDLSSIYDILNGREKGLGDFTSVNFEVESYRSIDGDLSRPNTQEQILPIYGSRPTAEDSWSSATRRKHPFRSVTAGIRPAISLPPLERESPVPGTPSEPDRDSLESWMSSLAPEVRRVPLNHLFIPGSHDSFSFSLAPEEDIGPDAPEVVANLDSCCPCMARPAILRWSVTQRAAVGDQLKHGIRYFDIRVAVRNSRFFFVHGLYGEDLEPLLFEILQFLLKHPGEVVLLDFQHFHGLDAHDHAALTTILKTTFSDLLCPFFHQIKHLSLSYLARFKYQVLVFYRHTETMQAVSWLWSTDSIPNPWPNTTSTTRMISFLEDNLKQRDPQTFFVTQCILTPSGKYLILNLAGTLEMDMAAPCNHVVEKWVTHLPRGPQGPNVIMTDFVEQDDWAVPRAVVNRNSATALPSTALQRY